MRKVGQIYKQANGEKFVISHIADGDCFLIYNDGYTVCYGNKELIFIFDTLIAEYPTWQEAVNSKEFKGE